MLIKARKYGLLYFDGEIISVRLPTINAPEINIYTYSFQRSNSEYDDENFVVLQKSIHDIRKAFADMRARHSILPAKEDKSKEHGKEGDGEVQTEDKHVESGVPDPELKTKPKKIVLRRKHKAKDTNPSNQSMEKSSEEQKQDMTKTPVTTPILKKKKSFTKKSVSFTTDDK